MGNLFQENLSRAELARSIAYLPQGKNVPDISADRMVLHGRFPYLNYPRRYRESDFQIAREAMRQMGIEELAGMQMSRLSGGMRQKVYLAMALAQEAPAIVMDEPTTYLDIGQQMKFAGIVRRLSGEGKTIVLVLHDILLALKISHRIAAVAVPFIT
ncbi:MAG: ABC transporter ATP-binding protein [Lachnospiraceae bacterium]|nr:ABC transporter ATP-binding protein [Lachnospiraceae bacterium]